MHSSRSSRLRKSTLSQNDETQNNNFLGPFDKWLFYIIVVITVFGLISVFSAAGPDGIRTYDDPLYFFKRQLVFDVLGIALMIGISYIDYNIYRRFSIPIGIAVTLLIGATYVFGSVIYGGERWIRVGPITIQPSELGKLAAVILAAEAMAFSKTIFDIKLIKNLALAGVMIILILKQPSLSVAMITSGATLVVLFMGSFPLALLVPALAGGAVVVWHVIRNTEYQWARIVGWLNPWEYKLDKGYNIIQSWYAFGSGGLFGVGFGNSKQKLFYLPFRHTDFIFAVISEEFGFIGALTVIGFFIAFTYRGLTVANNCENIFGRLLAIGITSTIALQAFINMGVATGVMPPTGITLPLISYGGSSSLAIFLMLGILLNISRKRIQRLSPCS